MKLKRLIFTALALLTIGTALAAPKASKIYMFGFAASFNDSTIYLTDIQEVDSAYIGHGGFLYSRENYSYQFREWLSAQGMKHSTCVTSFADSRSKIEKKYLKMRKQYTGKKRSFTIKMLDAGSFRYRGIYPEADEIQKDLQSKADQKAKKKAAKEAKKKEKAHELIEKKKEEARQKALLQQKQDDATK